MSTVNRNILHIVISCILLTIVVSRLVVLGQDKPPSDGRSIQRKIAVLKRELSYLQSKLAEVRVACPHEVAHQVFLWEGPDVGEIIHCEECGRECHIYLPQKQPDKSKPWGWRDTTEAEMMKQEAYVESIRELGRSRSKNVSPFGGIVK